MLICNQKRFSFKELRRLFKNNFFVVYSFVISITLMTLIYALFGVFPFGDHSVLFLDMHSQYVSFFEAFRDVILEGSSLIYSWSRPLGGEFLGMFFYYLASPLSYLVVIFPESMITEALFVMILLKSGISAATMTFYLARKRFCRKSVFVSVLFGIVYALCSFYVVYSHNIMWMDAVMLLPLVIYGEERLISAKKPAFFIFSLVLSIISNYYLGYMTCLFVAVYFFYYYFSNHKTPEGFNKREFIKAFGRILYSAALVVLLSMVAIIPSYYSLTFGKTTSQVVSWAPELRFNIIQFLSVCFPLSFNTLTPQGLPYIYSSLLVLLLVPIYFLSKNISLRKKILSAAMIVFFVLSFSISSLDLIWHGFQRPNWLNYRYSFIFVFFMITLASQAFHALQKAGKKHTIFLSAGISILMLLLVLIFGDTGLELYSFSIGLVLVAIFTLLLLGIKKIHLAKGALLFVVCLELLFSSWFSLIQLEAAVINGNRSEYYEFFDEYENCLEYLASDTSFYRADKLEKHSLNDNYRLKLKGVSGSTSTLHKPALLELRKLGYPAGCHCVYYSCISPFADSLLGLKYVVSSEPLESSPYSLVYSDTLNGKYVYLNENALSLAFGVSHTILETDYESFEGTSFEYQNLLASTMTDISLGSSALFTEVPAESSFEIIQNNENPDKEETVYTFRADLSDFKNSSAIYFYTNASFTGGVINNGREFEFQNVHKLPSAHLLNASECHDSTSVSITVSGNNDNVVGSFYILNSDALEKSLSALSSCELVIDSHSDTNIQGHITTDEERKLIFTSIPYDDCWNVYVDGEKVETQKAIGAFLVFEIGSPGAHQVEFRYIPTPFIIGSIISACTFVGILMFLWLKNRLSYSSGKGAKRHEK